MGCVNLFKSAAGYDRRDKSGVSTLQQGKKLLGVCLCLFAAGLILSVPASIAYNTAAFSPTALCYAYLAVAVITVAAVGLLCRRLTRSKPPKKPLFTQLNMLLLAAAVCVLTVIATFQYLPDFFEQLSLWGFAGMLPYMYLKALTAVVGWAVSVLSVCACFAKRNNPYRAAISAVGAWAFLYMVSECSLLISLPDVMLYQPRILGAAAVALSVSYIRVSMYTRKIKDFARLRGWCALAGVFCATDLIFTLAYIGNPYHGSGLVAPAFSLLMGGFAIHYCVTLHTKYNRPDEPEAEQTAAPDADSQTSDTAVGQPPQNDEV